MLGVLDVLGVSDMVASADLATSEVAVALVSGGAVGLAVAVPLGPVGLLVLDRAATHGTRIGVAAGTGVAAADACYAVVAVVAGATVAVRLAPHAGLLMLLSGTALALLGAVGVVGALRAGRGGGTARTGPAMLAAGRQHPGGTRQTGEEQPAGGRRHGGGSATRASVTLFALTLLNPLTVSTFTALIVGLGGQVVGTHASRIAFVVGVAAASWGWQTALALTGAALGARLSPRARVATGLVGNGLVLVLAGRLLLGTL